MARRRSASKLKTSSPSTCGSRWDARPYRLIVTSRKVRLVPGNLGRNYLALRRRDLTPLLLGHWRLEDAIAAGRIRASTQRAQRAAEVLFPQLPWHRPPLDDLVA